MSKILDLIGGLLPGKKGDGNFFLELKEDAEDTVSEIKQDVGGKVSDIKENVGDTINDALPTDVLNGSKATVSTEETPKNGKVASDSENKSQSKKVSIKERRQKEKQAAITSPILPTTETNKSKPVEPSEPQETAFASKYLLSNGKTPRRRPGANMDNFLEMARGVKAPVKK
ncbi:MAG: hypothetical protein ACFB02_02260 [Mastigocoleus sp.]